MKVSPRLQANLSYGEKTLNGIDPENPFVHLGKAQNGRCGFFARHGDIDLC